MQGTPESSRATSSPARRANRWAAPIGVLCLAALAPACVANIRPPTIGVDAPPSSSFSDGRRLIEAAAERQGLQAWRRAKTVRFQMTDEWKGVLAALGNPWPAARVKVRMELKVNSFDARATFLEGEEAGTTWGLQSWRTYVRPAEGPAQFQEDDDIRFILPAEQYLLEFPFRALAIEKVMDAGPETVRGVLYDRVFFTWGSLEAHSEADQFLAYINRATGRVEKVHYTIRDFAGFATGTIHYADFRDFGGWWIPLSQAVTGAVDDDPADYLHLITIDEATVQLDAFPDSELVVDPSLPVMFDQKPS